MSRPANAPGWNAERMRARCETTQQILQHLIGMKLGSRDLSHLVRRLANRVGLGAQIVDGKVVVKEKA